MSNAEQFAWESFCMGHPHEAAEMDWQRFVAYVQTKAPRITEQEVRQNLQETEEVRHES